MLLREKALQTPTISEREAHLQFLLEPDSDVNQCWSPVPTIKEAFFQIRSYAAVNTDQCHFRGIIMIFMRPSASEI